MKDVNSNSTYEELFPEGFTFGHNLVYLYWSFAAYTDGEFAKIELYTILEKLPSRIFEGDVKDVVTTVSQFFVETRSAADGREVERLLALLYQLKADPSLSITARKQIVSDLIDIAAADGQVHEAEVKMVEVVASELGVDASELVKDPRIARGR